ncbi:MAG: hypothetical protein ACI9BD_000023 [Candidatus Marinamargulisbacteria bacterium]|jgi:hypothetical protein
MRISTNVLSKVARHVGLPPATPRIPKGPFIQEPKPLVQLDSGAQPQNFKRLPQITVSRVDGNSHSGEQKNILIYSVCSYVNEAFNEFEFITSSDLGQEDRDYFASKARKTFIISSFFAIEHLEARSAEQKLSPEVESHIQKEIAELKQNMKTVKIEHPTKEQMTRFLWGQSCSSLRAPGAIFDESFRDLFDSLDEKKLIAISPDPDGIAPAFQLLRIANRCFQKDDARFSEDAPAGLR